jgi:hypothetical protein
MHLSTKRNFECPVTGVACEEPQCKTTLCVLEQEAGKREDAHALAEADKYRKEALEVARLWFEVRGKRKPTDEQLRKVARHPKIMTEAKRRLAERAAAIGKIDKSSIDL